MNADDVLATIPRPPHTQDGHGSFRLLLRPSPETGLTCDEVRDALRAAYRDVDGRVPDWPYPGAATVGERDGTISIDVEHELHLTDPRTVLGDAVEHLREQGHVIELELESYVTSYWPRRRIQAAGLVLRGDLRERDEAGRAATITWGIPADVTADVVAVLDEQLFVADVPQQLVQSGSGMPTPPGLLRERLPHVVRTGLPTEWHQETDETWTRVRFEAGGRLVVARRRRGAPAVDDARALVPVIEELAPRLDHAFVRDFPPNEGWQAFVSGATLPPEAPSGTWIAKTRPLESEFTIDAYGIQLLTDAHLEQVGDLSAWVVRDVGAGRHLVAAPDLEQWYLGDLDAPLAWLPEVDHPFVSDHVLARARADFAEAIITEDRLIAEFQRWIAAAR